MWYEVAIIALIFAVGNIFFGILSLRTPVEKK
jgi:hypothetical protein